MAGFVPQELRHFLEGDFPAFVDVEVFEGLLEVFLVDFLPKVYGRNQEFGVVYFPRAVRVDEVDDLLYLIVIDLLEVHGAQHRLDLLGFNDPIPILIDRLE